MRLFLLASVLASASIGSAQTYGSVPPDRRPAAITEGVLLESGISQALETHRTDGTIELHLSGREIVGRTETSIAAVLYYRLSRDPRTGRDSRAEVDLRVSRNGVPALRVVGDGITLRRYDLNRFEVISTVYGFNGTKMPSGYSGSDVPNLMTQLRAATPGDVAPLVRLLSEMFPAGITYSSRYTSWMPGFQPLPFSAAALVESGGPRRLNILEDSKDDTIVDPVVPNGERTYLQKLSRWVMYGVSNPVTNRTVVFELADRPNEKTSDPEDTEPVIQTVYYADRNSARILALIIEPKVVPEVIPNLYQPYGGGTVFRPIAPGH